MSNVDIFWIVKVIAVLRLITKEPVPFGKVRTIRESNHGSGVC